MVCLEDSTHPTIFLYSFVSGGSELAKFDGERKIAEYITIMPASPFRGERYPVASRFAKQPTTTRIRSYAICPSSAS